MSDILLSGFADEAAPDKTLDQQFSTMAALGLEYLSIRFLDVGNGVQNVLELDDAGLTAVRERLSAFGLGIASIGSPIGKVKLVDVEDGTNNRFVPFDEYLNNDVNAAIHAAQQLETRLIRGFSFYHPRNSDHHEYLSQAIDQLGAIVELCDKAGLTFGLEVEANLIGHTGSVLREIHQQVNHPAMVLIFDGGNLVSQGFDSGQILEQFREMLPGLGWMHVKDYLRADDAGAAQGEYIDEEKLDRFVPADRGSTGHVEVFRELSAHLPTIAERLARRGVPGFFVDLEPHLRGGGQFGGYSGPDGMGVALRCLCQVLEQAQVGYQLRSFEELNQRSAE